MKSEKQPISSEDVYNDILDRIIALKLEPGQLISENQMVSEYGVSRSVIRTAFTRLNQAGFIDVYPQRGSYVSLIDLNYISDLLMLRTAVEKEVIYELMKNLKLDERRVLIKKLEINLSEQEKCIDEKDYSGRFPLIDAEFHHTMIDSVNRASLMDMLKVNMHHISRWRNFDVAFDHRVPQLIEEHKAILDAIKKDDLILAQDKMADHLETITAIADRAMEKYPNYFKQA